MLPSAVMPVRALSPVLVRVAVGLVASVGWTGLASTPLAAQPMVVFSDGFESGNTLAWSASVGEPALPPADVFRMSDLDLRDPHVYISPLPFTCFDFTDADVPGVPGSAFNGQLAAAITTDGDGDGFLDTSLLLEFRPFDELASALRLDFGSGLCTAPMAGTSCAPDPAAVPQTTAYDGLTAGTCLAPVSGTTYPPYAPEISTPTAPCFISVARRIVFDLNGVGLPLSELELGGEWTATPVAGFVNGLMRGFLSEADAANVLLPPGIPIVGGQPISVLLPGGTGNCAAHDDRDLLNGVSGWWFYFNFPADAVTWTGN